MQLPPDILIVEDHPGVVFVLRMLFTAWGWEAEAAETEAAAFAALKGRRFALVLLDLMLPDGNGINILRYLRGLPGAPPVVVSTGNDAPLVMDAVNALRPDAVFLKPVDVVAMQAFVDRVKADYYAPPPG